MRWVGWIRDADGQPERRPTDVAVFVVFSLGVAITGLWAQSQSSVDLNLFRTVNGLADNMNGVARAFYSLGSIFAVVVVSALLLFLRQVRVASRVAVAGASTWLIAVLLNDLLGTHPVKGLGVNVRFGDGPTFPAANVAAITALALAASPYFVRLLRRWLFVVIVLVGLATMYLGVGYPSDVLGGALLGLAVAALVRVALGSPAGQPTTTEVREALLDLGFNVADLHHARQQVARAAVMDVELTTGEHLRVQGFGRDQRDAQLAAKLWRRMMYHEPGLDVLGSRSQQVEHIAYTLMLAERAGVDSAVLVKTGVGGSDVALLVTSPPSGSPLADLEPHILTDEHLANLWHQIDQLHRAGISHGDLDPLRILVGEDASVALDDFSSADAGADQYWRDRDDAAALVMTAQLVGNERAIDAALTSLGKDRVGEVIPLVQPAALPAGLTRGAKHLNKTLKQLRSDLATATGAQDVAPLKIKRLSLINIGMLAGVLFALAIAIPSLEGIDWASVQSQFTNAIWGWAVLAFVLYPLVPMAWATALLGCVNTDLPFVPTVLTQLACTFLNLITPNGIGGTALQLDYLHKQGVPVASGGSAMVLSTGVGGAIQMALFLIAAAITATTVQTSSSSSNSTSLWIIAFVAAAVGIVLMVPKIRGKVVPAVKRAVSDIWSVLRNPKKAMQLFGGDLAGNLLYPALLGLCLLAFHQRLDYAQLVVVQVGAGMLGNVAPVPGGIGVQEAALTAGLTSFGIASSPALAAVLVFRAITFAIPPIFGFFTLRWLRAKGYA
jgi:uncharacterized membrane protein YbhN (UPF0104 family)/membrane-associated phospholipid phosphatase/tRNA A-37 threonylcarbamoyl transferase component Bud32